VGVSEAGELTVLSFADDGRNGRVIRSDSDRCGYRPQVDTRCDQGGGAIVERRELGAIRNTVVAVNSPGAPPHAR
jgi:hypothetical protein